MALVEPSNYALTRTPDYLYIWRQTIMASDPRELYLDLMKRCLINSIYGDSEEKSWEPPRLLRGPLARLFRSRRIRIVRRAPFRPHVRAEGRDWPPNAHTMIGLKRLNNLQFCIEDVLARQIPGDLIETGVWRGGATIFMRAVLKAHDVSDRLVWVADSFAGLPPPNEKKYPRDAGDRHHTYKQLAVRLEQVKANFEKYDLLDNQVRFLKGWFHDTLPAAPINRLAVLRLDGDMYGSTMDALTNLYPKLSVGGYVIVDDYGWIPACQQAVRDFRESHGIREQIVEVDWTAVYWQRLG